MKLLLTKKNRKTTDFVLFESDDKFVKISSGKIGKSGIGNATLNAGSSDKALEYINEEAQKLRMVGYIDTTLPNNFIKEDIIFDKAKWHVNDDFPSELEQYQSCVHSGMFICWLINHKMIEDEFRNENFSDIKLLLERKITPSKFYEEALDGIFDAEGYTQEAIQFTSEYFDFKNGQYINDYLSVLDPNETLPSIFHVEDSWENYDKLSSIINERYSDWKDKK